MAATASRLLGLLESLQAQPVATGTELAGRLGIDTRTLRRYVAALQGLGIPVEGQRGVGGGYRLRPGYRLPPLMLSDEEAVVVVLGLAAARRFGLDTADGASEGALTKIHRVLPERLRRRVEALEATLAFTGSAPTGATVPGETVLLVAEAIRRRRRVHTGYRSYAGATGRREVSPHGVVFHAGRWYLAAHDHGRDDSRTFRIDRMSGAEIGHEAALPPPAGFDAVAHVSASLARVPWTWKVEVELDLPRALAADRLPATLAELAEDEGRTLLRMRVESLDWMAGLLAGLDCGFAIRRPDELRASVGSLAARLAAASEPGGAVRSGAGDR